MDQQEGRLCLYEVLNVDRFCKEDDIKKAYKKQALINHPDKAPKGEEESYKEKFQTINDAYQILSNPQERAWYDAHRDEYLNPHKKDKNYQGFTFNIKDYLIEENLEESEFYKVYSEVFQKIIIEEEKYRQNSEEFIETRESYLQSPILGNKNTDLEQVEKFYNYWNNFVSCQNFAWADLWDEREGENRREKRFIQKTNQIERKKAKRKYMNQIERLVQFVKNRDPRYEKLVLIMKEKKIKEQKLQEELRIKQEKEWQEKKEKLLQEELLKYEQERQERGESDDSYLEQEYQDDLIFSCKICDKEFKSENQLNNHNKSKQHLKNKKKLMKEVAMVDEQEKVQEIQEEIQEFSNKNKKKKKKIKKITSQFSRVCQQHGKNR